MRQKQITVEMTIPPTYQNLEFSNNPFQELVSVHLFALDQHIQPMALPIGND